MVVPADLVPFLGANWGLVAAGVWRRLVACSLASSRRLCGGLEGLEAKVLHPALLLLVVIGHAKRRAFSCCLRLERELSRLGYGHLVVGEGRCGSIADTGGVCAAVLVDVELLLHVFLVSRRVVCGKK